LRHEPPAISQEALGSAVAAKKWARGSFQCGQAFSSGEEYTLSGKLVFKPGVELEVSVKGCQGLGWSPASFEATGKGKDGPTKGAIYCLKGWVFPSLPIISGASRPLSIKGSVRAAHGSDARPEIELGGMPGGDTVGLFTLVSKGDI